MFRSPTVWVSDFETPLIVTVGVCVPEPEQRMVLPVIVTVSSVVTWSVEGLVSRKL